MSDFSSLVDSIGSYPFMHCEHPRFVRNRYTREEIQVPCGCCSACLSSKSSNMSLQCSIEEQDHKYCFFVTLTYSNFYVPLCEPVLSNDKKYYILYNRCNRLLSDDRLGEILGYDAVSNYKSTSSMSLLQDKCNLGRYIPYANKIDLQLFIKRFRKQLSKYTCEKIRYYAVSEYGPVHYRPHYHLLFFFDERETFEVFSKVLSTCWTYGRVDASLSRKKCSSYVAGYVNSCVSLPRLFTCSSLRPFSTHSTFFAKGFYKGQAKKIYEDGPERFMFQSRSVCGNFIDFSPWRSLTTLFYPKCREFNRKSHAELLYSYTILRHVRQVFGDRPISELVDLINTSSVTEDNERIMRYFFGDRVDEYIFDDRTPSSIASELYLSKHFLEFCCSECFEWYVVQRIVEFYKYRDYCNLYMQYVQQEDMITRFPDFPDVWRFFYYNALPSFEYLPTLKNTPFYRQFVIDSRRMAEEKIKHKVLNDINLVFNLNL